MTTNETSGESEKGTGNKIQLVLLYKIQDYTSYIRVKKNNNFVLFLAVNTYWTEYTRMKTSAVDLRVANFSRL